MYSPHHMGQARIDLAFWDAVPNWDIRKFPSRDGKNQQSHDTKLTTSQNPSITNGLCNKGLALHVSFYQLSMRPTPFSPACAVGSSNEPFDAERATAKSMGSTTEKVNTTSLQLRSNNLDHNQQPYPLISINWDSLLKRARKPQVKHQPEQALSCSMSCLPWLYLFPCSLPRGIKDCREASLCFWPFVDMLSFITAILRLGIMN